MQLVIHAPFGARINRAWGLALRKRFCRSFNFELQAAATDNGIVHLARRAALVSARHRLRIPAPRNGGGSAHAGAAARAHVHRALALECLARAGHPALFAADARCPPPIQRMRADDLMAAVFPDQAACPENLTGRRRAFPIILWSARPSQLPARSHGSRLASRACSTGIREGAIRTSAIDTPEPSPFSHEILNANPYAFLDDAPLEERRARAVQLRRTLRADFVEGAGALDPDAIAQVAAEVLAARARCRRVARSAADADHRPARARVGAVLGAAGRSGPCRRARRGAGSQPRRPLRPSLPLFWIAAERTSIAAEPVHPEPPSTPPHPTSPAAVPKRKKPAPPKSCAAGSNLGGPYRASDLSARLAHAAPRWWTQALAQLEAEGQILRGHFTPGASADEPEWCHRRLLARIHRLTIGRLRREIEPVTTADFVRFLHRWQHLAPGRQLHGADGTLQIIRQLQGYEISAAAWEAEVLPQPRGALQPEYLDQLCLSGEVRWGRLSPHPAFE